MSEYMTKSEAKWPNLPNADVHAAYGYAAL